MSDRNGVRPGLAGAARVALTLTAAVALLAAACGGEAISEGGDRRPSSSAGGGTSTPSETKGTGGGSGFSFPSVTLGSCMPGFDPNLQPERDCPWVTAGLCYDTKLAACACACPRDRKHTQCFSDIDDEPNGHVEVSCL